MNNSIKSLPNPPVAKKVPCKIEKHGDVRIDDYFWMREKTDPEVIRHLEAENAYKDAVLAPTAALQEKIFEEIKGRTKEDDSQVPYKSDDWFYYSRTEAGKQYPILCRKFRTIAASEEIILDCNALAAGRKYFSLGASDVSPNHEWLAYAVDFDGSEHYQLHFKNLKTGHVSNEVVPEVYYSVVWANDNRTVFYTRLDQHERPDRVMRHVLGTDPADDVLVYKEEDSKIFVGCAKTRSERYIIVEAGGKVTSEVRFIDADKPESEPKLIEPRRHGVLYEADHHEDRFLIYTNDKIQNFRIVEAPVSSPGATNWKEVHSGSADVFIEGIDVFRTFMIVKEKSKGLDQLRVVDFKDGSNHLIEFPEPAYVLSGDTNAEYDVEKYRFRYNSMVTPTSVFDYHVRNRTRDTLKVQEIPSGYDKTQYRSERVWATAKDGTQVPISLVYKLDENGEFKRDGSRPLYLYGYGSYGMAMPPGFSPARLSLLDRGFVFAMAHIRGGSEMGRQWYETSKFLTKMNTFTDMIACAEHLIENGYTRKGEIAISGGSAGGMLVGAVLNMRPELFKLAVADVPFVDVVNTMLDDTLPLTTLEYEEWGNPNDPQYYHYMKSYSPYDNVKRHAYPHMLVTSGLNDPRVTYWEPAKWVAKLREMKTDSNVLIQHINMSAGHGGASGRYEAMKERAREYAFIFMIFGR